MIHKDTNKYGKRHAYALFFCFFSKLKAGKFGSYTFFAYLCRNFTTNLWKNWY